MSILTIDLELEDVFEVVLREELKPIDRSVLLSIYYYHREFDGQVKVSYSNLQKLANCSKPTLIKSVNYLEKLGYLVVERDGNVANKIANQYFLTIPSTKNKGDLLVKKFNYEISSDLIASNSSTVYDPKQIINILESTLNIFTSKESLLYIQPYILSTFNTIYTRDTIRTINTIENFINLYSYNIRKIENYKGAEFEMKQSKLFRSAPERINKKALTGEELFSKAMSGEIKLNYGEFIKAYKQAHRKYLEKVPGGKFTQEEVGDTLEVLTTEKEVKQEELYEVIKELLVECKSNLEIPHLSLRMIRESSDVGECLKDAIFKVRNKDLFEDQMQEDVQEDESTVYYF